jgi:hypothetical protein
LMAAKGSDRDETVTDVRAPSAPKPR